MKICQALRSIREAKNLTAEQLALSVNVEPSTISRAERGERRISTDLLEKIAAAMKEAGRDLGIPVEWGGDWKGFKDGPHFQLPWKEYPK